MAHDSWEKTCGILFKDQPVKGYSLVRITLNEHLFHVDGRVREENRDSMSRFIFSDIDDLVTVIRSDSLKNIDISVQLRKHESDDKRYTFCKVLEISEITYMQGEKEVVYLCCNTKTYGSMSSVWEDVKYSAKNILYKY